MAYISHEYGFIFFAAPATGSTAVLEALERAGIGEYLPQERVVRDGEMIVRRKHSTLAELETAALLDEKSAEYLKVVGVRNPFSFHVAKYLRDAGKRLQELEDPSSWINELPAENRKRAEARIRRIAEMSFEEYLRDFLDRPRGPFAVQAHFLDGMDLFIHQEDLSRDFDRFCDLVGVEAVGTLERVNVTSSPVAGRSYRDHYTPDLIELVEKRNGPSFDLFPEYSFEGYDTSKARSTALELTDGRPSRG